MKAFIFILTLVWSSHLSLFSQTKIIETAEAGSPSPAPQPLAILGLDRTGLLTWSNRFCPSQPIYEVLHSKTLPGSWSHRAYVTNQNSFALTLPQSGPADAGFFRLAWVGEAPMVFDYIFDEGYGFPAVIGQIGFVLLPVSPPYAGAWALEEVFAIDGDHPVGNGQVRLVRMQGVDSVRVYLTGPVDGVYLEGTLERGDVAGKCSYTKFNGTVYEDGFGGGNPIGTFIATRATSP